MDDVKLARFVADVLATDDTGMGNYVDATSLTLSVLDGAFDLTALAAALNERYIITPKDQT